VSENGANNGSINASDNDTVTQAGFMVFVVFTVFVLQSARILGLWNNVVQSFILTFIVLIIFVSVVIKGGKDSDVVRTVFLYCRHFKIPFLFLYAF
jgi:hypothetical protein